VAAGEDEDRDGGSRRAWVPLAAAAVVALLVGALVALGAAGGGDEGSTAAQDTAGQQETAAEEPAAEEQPAEPEPEPAPERDPAPADGRSPAELDRAGFELIGQERYEEAVPLLEAAVQGFRDAGDTGSAGYAFALFNLGTAYNRSGNPAAAIPLFDERLSFSDDRREQVKDERDDAKQRLKDAEDDD
jgi:tetratricopeptide (TPR) repeat protein